MIMKLKIVVRNSVKGIKTVHEYKNATFTAEGEVVQVHYKSKGPGAVSEVFGVEDIKKIIISKP